MGDTPNSKIPPKVFWNTCIADDSGIARRLCIAIGAFRAQHGAWPSRLIAGTLTDRLLREQLTAEGYAVLQQRLPIALGKRDALVVRDETGRDYDYNADHLFTLETPLGEVTMWLWGCRPPDPWGG